MRYRVRHRTAYAYAEPVSLAHHAVHLVPRLTVGQMVKSASVMADPVESWRAEAVDHFGNPVLYLTLDRLHDAFAVELQAVVEVAERLPAAPSPGWEAVAAHASRATHEAEFTFPSAQAQAASLSGVDMNGIFVPRRPIVDVARTLNAWIHEHFTYDPHATDVATPIDQVLSGRRGVCQDFAHVAIAVLRARGLPARYVSGYIRTYRAQGDPLRGADASHAWVGLWCGPDLGWLDFDPTNNLLVSQDHITVAWGRDYGDVSPVRGVLLGGGAHRVKAEVTVESLPGAADDGAGQDMNTAIVPRPGRAAS